MKLLRVKLSDDVHAALVSAADRAGVTPEEAVAQVLSSPRAEAVVASFFGQSVKTPARPVRRARRVAS
jgi:hypothetical protein